MLVIFDVPFVVYGCCWLAEACTILLCEASNCTLAQHRFWQSVLSPCSSHSGCYFTHTLAIALAKHTSNWPYSPRRRLPVTHAAFLHLRLGCHGLPTAAAHLAGASHMDRADTICLSCNSGVSGNEKHMILVCYPGSFTLTDTVCSLFAQQDHLGVLNYCYSIGCLDFKDI